MNCFNVFFRIAYFCLFEKRKSKVFLPQVRQGRWTFSLLTDEFFEILTDPASFSAVYEALSEGKDYNFVTAEVRMVPQTMVELTDEEDLKKMNKLLEMLDDNDDVQNVWHNWEMPEEPDED